MDESTFDQFIASIIYKNSFPHTLTPSVAESPIPTHRQGKLYGQKLPISKEIKQDPSALKLLLQNKFSKGYQSWKIFNRKLRKRKKRTYKRNRATQTNLLRNQQIKKNMIAKNLKTDNKIMTYINYPLMDFILYITF